MERVLFRLDYFLMVVVILGAYSGWKYDNIHIIDYIWPLATIFFIHLSKRIANGRGFSGFLAYFGTTFYILAHWKDLLRLDTISLLYLDSPHILFYIAIGVITLICMLSRLTTYTLTVTWTVYFILLFFTIISQHSIGELISFLNSSDMIASIIMSYNSILILSIIGGIFADVQLRNRLALRS